MTQPSVPSPAPPLPPPPQPTAPPSQPSEDSICVRCAGCRMILKVAPGLTEFACPTCRMPQMLPPSTPPSRNLAAHGIDPTKIQIPCACCKAILNVPRGLSRFSCPQCNVDLAVDLSKVKQFLPPLLEEVNRGLV